MCGFDEDHKRANTDKEKAMPFVLFYYHPFTGSREKLKKKKIAQQIWVEGKHSEVHKDVISVKYLSAGTCR